MAPPTAPLNLDVEAISGICGSISIACWVVVFSPQILENFRRGSADGLSVQFVIVWLLGDVFNILGAVLQGVLPTMIILAVYYTIADMVLMAQCFYYRGFTWRDEIKPPGPKPPPPSLHAIANGDDLNRAGAGHPGEPHERTGLLAASSLGNYDSTAAGRRGSWSSLSPVVPFVDSAPAATRWDEEGRRGSSTRSSSATRLQNIAFHSLAVLMVCASGVAGWYLSRPRAGADHQQPPPDRFDDDEDGGVLEFNFWGQVFGWLCAALYLGSRFPQLLLNWRRKSTEGVSMLFFIFACLGNLTYVLSIFAFEPHCLRSSSLTSSSPECEPGEAARAYGQYLLVNLSWMAGSLGTLLLDLGIFVQYFMYNKDDEDYRSGGADDGAYQDYDNGADSDDDGESIDSDRWDPPPLLRRDTSTTMR